MSPADEATARRYLADLAAELERVKGSLARVAGDDGSDAETPAEAQAWRRNAPLRLRQAAELRERLADIYEELGYCPKHGDACDCTTWHEECDSNGCEACDYTGRVAA